MKKIILYLCIISSVFGAQAQLKIIKDLPSALTQAKDQNKKIVLFAYSTSCGWCLKMKETTFQDQALITALNTKFIFAAINAESGNLPPYLVPKFVPMTYVINPKTQKVIKELPGYLMATEFISEIQGL